MLKRLFLSLLILSALTSEGSLVLRNHLINLYLHSEIGDRMLLINSLTPLNEQEAFVDINEINNFTPLEKSTFLECGLFQVDFEYQHQKELKPNDIVSKIGLQTKAFSNNKDFAFHKSGLSPPVL